MKNRIIFYFVEQLRRDPPKNTGNDVKNFEKYCSNIFGIRMVEAPNNDQHNMVIK